MKNSTDNNYFEINFGCWFVPANPDQAQGPWAHKHAPLFQWYFLT